jgi:hypothetical protein
VDDIISYFIVFLIHQSEGLASAILVEVINFKDSQDILECCGGIICICDFEDYMKVVSMIECCPVWLFLSWDVNCLYFSSFLYFVFFLLMNV